MDYTRLALVVGIVGVGAYFVINATSSSACNGTWTDYINPACIFSGISSEINTVLIIVALVVVLVVGLLAFGPSTQHLAGAARGFALA